MLCARALHMLCTCSAHMLCACSAQRYDVFVSHCKKLGASEDRALWVVDALRATGLKPFFDRLDLLEISEEVLKRNLNHIPNSCNSTPIPN